MVRHWKRWSSRPSGGCIMLCLNHCDQWRHCCCCCSFASFGNTLSSAFVSFPLLLDEAATLSLSDTPLSDRWCSMCDVILKCWVIATQHVHVYAGRDCFAGTKVILNVFAVRHFYLMTTPLRQVTLHVGAYVLVCVHVCRCTNAIFIALLRCFYL